MIITLHRVYQKPPITFNANKGLYTSIDTLNEFIKSSNKQNKKFISLHEYLNLKDKKNNISITFDDGYLDNYEIAYPFLKNLNIPFTLYITTNYIHNKIYPWWFLMEDYLAINYLNISNYNKYNLKKVDNFFKDKLANKQFIYLRNEILNNKFDINKLAPYKKFSIKRLGERAFMNWQEIEVLSSDKLVTIGSHSVSHRRLSKCTKKEAAFEIHKSKKIIEEKLSINIKHFAYPYGGVKDFNKKDIKLLKKHNYKSSVSTISRNSIFFKNDNFSISRFPLSEIFKNPQVNFDELNRFKLINILKDFMIFVYKKII